MGTIRIYPRASGGYIARTLVRDYDGHVRPVAKTGKSKAAARSALIQTVSQRHVGHAGDITPDTKVDVVCEAWWEEFSKRPVSPNTKQLYRDRLDRQVIPSLGQLRVRELTVGTVDRHIQTVAEKNGAGLARTVRAVLSGVCKYAARHDALDRNIVRDAGTITGPKKKRQAQALTLDQARDLRQKIRLDRQAAERDICDLMDFMLATGLRISEACAVQWDDLEMADEKTAAVKVGWKNVVREKGIGVYIREEESNKLTPRHLELPSWAVVMLKARKAVTVGDLVFPSAKGMLRDPSNTSADIKEAFTNAGYSWATSHIFRKTVATLMDENGLSARAAADQLGHAKVSMTQDNYFGRRRGSTGAKEILENLHEIIKEEDE
jgi:integrase